MLSIFHSAHANLAFDELVRRVEAGLPSRVTDALGHSGKTLAQRLAQRIVELAFNPFVMECALRLREGKAPLPPRNELLYCGGICFDQDSGAVRPAWQLVIRSLVQYSAHWTLVLWRLLFSGADQRPLEAHPATLVFGIGQESLEYEGSDARFVEYCRSGPVLPLAEAKRLIVQSTGVQRSSAPEIVRYARFPLFALLRTSPVRMRARLKLILGHLLSPLRFIADVLRQPLLAILARDAAYVPLVEWMDRHGLIAAIVLTNSGYSNQPLWMRETDRRNFRTHMVWYSQNTVPHVFVSDGISSDLPYYRHLSSDTHWVWTSGYADYLRRLGVPGDMHVCGPILWYLPQPSPPRADGELCIALFDVTPVRDELALHFGLLYNYYCTDHMIRFVEETLSVCRELEALAGKRVRLLLKHKRSHSVRRDPHYIELIERLSQIDGALEVVPYQANMYAMIASSDLTIVVPYSSPAYVASHLGVRAIFFDPTRQLIPKFERTPLVEFASGREELLQIATENLGLCRGAPRRRPASAARH